MRATNNIFDNPHFRTEPEVLGKDYFFCAWLKEGVLDFQGISVSYSSDAGGLDTEVFGLDKDVVLEGELADFAEVVVEFKLFPFVLPGGIFFQD